MGNGATNPNTASGMLPATSNSSPYILTDVGTLFEYGGGPAWKVFDQLPAIGEASSNDPSDLEYINIGGESKCGIMVDLGELNEKCFDKFTFAKSAYTSGSWFPSRIIIQGSNSVGVSSVTDDITASNWDTLFKSFIEMYYAVDPEIGSYTLVDPAPEWSYGSWREEYFCWQSTTAYRYYRVMFGCSESAIANQAEYDTPWTVDEEWVYGTNSAAVSELRFIEEAAVPEGDEVVFVPEITTCVNYEQNHRIFIDGITVPAVIINESISSTVYGQYLGIDADTILMLHFDGDNASTVIVDSSAYDNVITQAGYGSERPGLIKGFTEYDLPGFDAACYFPSSYSTGIFIANSPLFDLGLSNTPFCIDFWAQMRSNDNIRNEEDNYLIRTGVACNDWNSATGIMYRLHRTSTGIAFRFNNGGGAFTSLQWLHNYIPYIAPYWYHIAVTFDGTTTRLFVNGVLKDSATGVYYKPTTCASTVIGMPNIPEYASGNGMMLNEFRVSSGVPRWITDFIVPDVPYIAAFTDRIVIVPGVTVNIVPTVRVAILPPPLTIPEIETVSSFSTKEIIPPGWTVLVPDISIIPELIFVQNIILRSNILTSNSLNLRIIEVIDRLVIPEILICEALLVADVFLGSKIQTPEIVINNTVFVEYKPPWYLVHPDQPKQAGINYSTSSDLKCIFLFYTVPGTTSAYGDDGASSVTVYKLSSDYGQTCKTITPPVDSGFIAGDANLKAINEDILLLSCSNYDNDPQIPEVRLYITYDGGVTWSSPLLYAPRWWAPTVIDANVGTVIGMSSSNSGEIIYTPVVRSLDYGATWRTYTFDAPDIFEDLTTTTYFDYFEGADSQTQFHETHYNESTITSPIISGDGTTIIAVCRYYERNPDKIGVYRYTKVWFNDDEGTPRERWDLLIPEQLEDALRPTFIDHGTGFIISKDAGVTWETPVTPFGTEAYYTGDRRDINFISTDGSVIIISGAEWFTIPENTDLPEYYRQHILYHVFLSIDTGATWTEINPPIDINTYIPIVPPEGYVTVVYGSRWSLTASDDMSVFAAYISGGLPTTTVYLSYDNCETWTEKTVNTQTISHEKIRISSDGSLISVGENVFAFALTNDLNFNVLNASPYFDTIISCVAVDSTGNKVLAGGSFLNQSNFAGKVWWPTHGDSFTNAGYSGCGVSTDGQVILAALRMTGPGGCLLLSNDGGESWKTLVINPVTGGNPLLTEVIPGSNWTASLDQWTWCSVSGDGQVMYAGVSNTGTFAISTYHSIDSGVTWTELGSFGEFIDYSTNYDGSIAIIDGTLKLSAGVFTTITISPDPLYKNWSTSMNHTGEIMIAVSGIYGSSYPVVWAGRVFKSVNYGVTWSEIFPCGDVDKPWGTCCISDDGTVMLVGTLCKGTNPGQLFLSVDAGSTWIEQGISSDWHILPSFDRSAMSSDGSVLYASGFGLWTNKSVNNESVVMDVTIPDISDTVFLEFNTLDFGMVTIQSVLAEITTQPLIPTIGASKSSYPVTTYRCVLTGGPDGLSDVTIPISSFQCRKTLLSSAEIPLSPRQINEVVTEDIPYGYARFCELNPESIFCNIG